MAPFEIGGRAIGERHPLFVIAELGLNHSGSVERALALVDAAAAAGAAAVKLQTLSADRLIGEAAPAPQHLADEERAGSLADFFRRFELDEAGHRAVVRRAREHGLAVLSTPLYEDAVDLLESIGVDGYKIASGDLTYTALIERAARTGKPLILSTGMSELDEVAAAVGHAIAAGARDLALLHCVSCYPVPAGCENLRAIQTLATTFAVPVGLSDHGCEPHTAAVAVALGASLYEKHLVLSAEDDAVDAAVSATPAELAAIVASAEWARLSLGHGRKSCLPIEQTNRVPSRRSLYAARALAPGAVVGADDVVALRPGDGLAPHYLTELVGTTVNRPIARHESFRVEDLSGTRPKVLHVD